MSNALQQLGSTRAAVDLASILVPPPLSEGATDHGEYEAWITELHDRASDIQAMTDDGDDPLLSGLASLRRQRNEIEQQMILLVAYMREKIKPRPYTLAQIAAAAGLSVSGTRTFYNADDVHLLDERITYAKRLIAAEQEARREPSVGEPSAASMSREPRTETDTAPT